MRDRLRSEDWTAFEDLNGEPLSPSGKINDHLTVRQERRKFFRRSLEKIDRKLDAITDSNEAISFLLFVRHDAVDKQIQRAVDRESELAQAFLRDIDERLIDATGAPPAEQKERLLRILDVETSHPYESSTPGVERLETLVRKRLKFLEDHHPEETNKKRTRNAPTTPEAWEKNAAMMHAYFSNHGTPENLEDVDEEIEKEALLDSFSHEHTWKKLREEGWATSKGSIEALKEALVRWAPHFEEKCGVSKATDAANPFEWPLQKDV